MLEVVKDFSVHTDVFSSGAVFHWADNDAIGVINVTHNDVIVAPAGNGGETSSEISSKEISRFNNAQVDCFCSCGRLEGVLGSTRCCKISGWDSTGRVDLTFLRASLECPFAVAKLVGRCFEMSSAVKPGQEEK